MIDFRYHLVSLISVFLALAVGIVLGAGPLQDSIGSTLTDQVNALRSEKDSLRDQLATSTEAVTHRDAFTEATAPTLLAGALTGRSIVVITLPGVEDDVIEPVTDAVTTAGGTVTGRIAVTDAWTASDREEDRAALVTKLATELPSGYVPTDGTTAEKMAQTLATSVTTSAATTTLSGSDAADAATALNGLTTAGLIEVDGDLNGLASGVMLMVPANPEATGGTSATATVTEEDVSAYLSLAAKLDSTSGGEVVTGPASAATSGGVLTSVRDDDTVSADVSTVDTGSTAMGVVTAVLAMEEQLSGGTGSYGFGEGVDAVLPAIPTTRTTSTDSSDSDSDKSNSGKKGDK